MTTTLYAVAAVLALLGPHAVSGMSAVACNSYLKEYGKDVLWNRLFVTIPPAEGLFRLNLRTSAGEEAPLVKPEVNNYGWAPDYLPKVYIGGSLFEIRQVVRLANRLPNGDFLRMDLWNEENKEIVYINIPLLSNIPGESPNREFIHLINGFPSEGSKTKITLNMQWLKSETFDIVKLLQKGPCYEREGFQCREYLAMCKIKP